ncbi:MAG: ring-cleaving dioxygenase [Paracoccaceae bacterium]
MATTIPGIHHVTAISGPPQDNVSFYTEVLDQRLVKRTVNFDAPDTWHLYYGDRTGSPGTIMTFFPFIDAGPGRPGPGMASAHAYAVPKGGFDAWIERVALEGREFGGPEERFGERLISLRDPDGAVVELIETDRPGSGAALDGFHSVTLWEADPQRTARVLTDLFGYAAKGEETSEGVTRLRLAAPGNARGRVIDLIRSDARVSGRQGAGTIHHIAFRAESDAAQLEWRERVLSAGLQVSPVMDRNYFHSIYFREPGGVLFEIATDPPGFSVDEPVETLGTALKLPAQYEAIRERIERVLPPLRVSPGVP